MTSNQSNNLFSGMEHLGFEETSDIEIYSSKAKTKTKEQEQIDEKELAQQLEDKQRTLLYDKEVSCPVCNFTFKARTVKVSAPRMSKKDSDLFIRYTNIDPYFYDVWLCNCCGYAAMKRDFEKIKPHQTEKVKKAISGKWKGRNYPDLYDVNIAIERYKLALLNYCVTESKNSSKAMTCLKTAWMYRILADNENEAIFLKQALDGFSDSYLNEDFPIYGMDRYTTMYLLGELHRRLNNDEDALQWFSKVITTAAVPQKLKDLGRDQKILIDEKRQAETAALNAADSDQDIDTSSDKKGFFSKLFK